MITIPVFFYEIFSHDFIHYLCKIEKEIREIEKILPFHYLVTQFQEIYQQLKDDGSNFIDDETIKEYYNSIKDFSSFLLKFKRLETEMNYFYQNKKIKSRLRNYYYGLFLKKKEIIYSETYQKIMNCTLNSLIEKEMDQEIFYIKQRNNKGRNYYPSLPVLSEN